ncbi:MAG: protein-ADP-ribose hydrolase [Tissierellia bacterium]|nr:protein-ADP-ribose hydrolase [Tissierellia bacterium]
MYDDEKLRWLIQYMAEEMNFSKISLPTSQDQLWSLYRGLANRRPPDPVTQEFLEIQDQLLSEIRENRGVVGLMDAQRIGPNLFLWQGDITRLQVDGIVNAANGRMLGCFVPGHHCIDNAIHTYAGVQLRLECNRLMLAKGHFEETGRAILTSAYNLPAKYILHTVGPIASDGRVSEEQEMLLASSYRACLQIAVDHGLESLAFCSISTGVFGFPKPQAADIALKTIMGFQLDTGSEMDILIDVFSDEDYRIYKEAIQAL